MREPIHFLILLGVLVGLASVSAAEAPQQPPYSFSITLRPLRSVVKSGHQVRLKAAVFASAVPTDTNRIYNAASSYNFDVRDSSGNAPPKWKDLKVGGTVIVDLDPHPGLLVETAGTTYTEDLDVSGVYDLTRPGTYSVQTSDMDAETKAWVKSNTITVTVVPDETSQPSSSSSGAPFSLTIWLDRGSPDYRCPFRLYIITTNISDHTISLESAKHESPLSPPLCSVDVLDSNGYPPPKTNVAFDSSPLASLRFCGQPFTLKPGEAWAEPILVNSLYQMATPGEYTVQARRWDRESKTWVRSNKITDTISPWNAPEH